MTAFLFQLINFIILISVVGFFAKRMLDKYFRQQREILQNQIQSAAADFEKVQHEFELMKEKLERLDTDLQLTRKDAESSLQNEAKKLKTETDDFINKLSTDLQLKLSQETERTKEDFQKNLVQEAFEMARESLSAKLLKEDESWTTQLVQNELPQGKKTYASK